MTSLAFERRALSLFEAMLEVDEAEREAWLTTKTAEDAELKLRVTAIWQSEKQLNIRTGDYLESVDPTPVPERIGSYRITGVIGSGGMGTVFSADRDDGSFEHSVAIKLIKPGMFSERLAKRFNRERQILARLSHPHITRLFDGGTTETGQPYIVMERIKGAPLLDWLAAENPNVETRLNLFIDICGAVGHAHRNLVIHRDLTPVNVLVDENGNAKLIDFGIARPEGELQTSGELEAADKNELVRPLRATTMTPGYAAPERIAGDAATVLSDVYSAGKMLEALLHGLSFEELDAVIAKAAADDPSQRYLSIDQMADDIRAFLAGERVRAMPDSKRYRFGKLIARNRAVAVIGTALALAMVVGSVATGWWWREAVVARDQADMRFAEVRGIAAFMLFDLYDELVPISGNTQALSLIADEARAYLERLSAADVLSPELRLEIARAYHRLSSVSGNPEGPNLGRREDAALFLDRALADLEALRLEYPDNPEYAEALAQALYSQAVFLFIAIDDNEGSMLAADRSAELFGDLSKRFPRNFDYRRAWYGSRIQAAKPYIWIDQGDVGIDVLEELIAEMEQDQLLQTNNPVYLLAIAGAYSELGYTQSWHFPTDSPEYAYALTAMNKAIVIYDDLFLNGPENMRDDLRSILISALFKRALVQSDLASASFALADLERAEGYARFLISRDPNDEDAKSRLDTIYSQKGYVLLDLGRVAEAEVLARNLLAQRTERLARDPDNPGLLREAAGARQLFAQSLEEGNKPTACDEYAETMADWDRIGEVSELNAIDKSNSIDLIEIALQRCGRN